MSLLDIKNLKSVESKEVFYALVNQPEIDKDPQINKVKYLTFNFLIDNLAKFNIKEVNKILSSGLFNTMKGNDKISIIIEYFNNHNELIDTPSSKWFENINKKYTNIFKDYLTKVIEKEKINDVLLFNINFLKENINLIEQGSLDIQYAVIESHPSLILNMKNILIDPLLNFLEKGIIKELDILDKISYIDKKDLKKIELFVSRKIINNEYSDSDKRLLIAKFPINLLNTIYNLNPEKARECAQMPHEKDILSYVSDYDIEHNTVYVNLLQEKLLNEGKIEYNSIYENLFNNFSEIIFSNIDVDNHGYSEKTNYLSYVLRANNCNSGLVSFLSVNYQNLNEENKEISFVIALNKLFNDKNKTSILIDSSYELINKYFDKFIKKYSNNDFEEEIGYLKTLKLSKVLDKDMSVKNIKPTTMKV